MHKYGIIIYWSEEDHVYIAEVPELPGCMTHGDTQAAALAHANEAIQGWIETANKFGDPVPKPGGARVASSTTAATQRRVQMDSHKDSVRRGNPRNFYSAATMRPKVNPKAH